MPISAVAILALVFSVTAGQPPVIHPAAPTLPEEPTVAPRPPAAPATGEMKGAEQRWRGTITIPPETRLEFFVSLRGAPARPGEEQMGTVSIPAQMLRDGPLDEVRFDGEIMSVRLPIKSASEPLWPVWELNIDDGGKTAQGSMRQGGQAFDVTAERLEAGAPIGPKRPQTPKGPFPYESREVLFDGAGGAKLAGTMTIPAGKGPHPCVVLLTGSGPQDRDETIFDHKPFAVIADHLARHGIAALRFDDRGVGGSTAPKKGEETTDDFALDAIEAVKFAGGAPGIDRARVGLVGHSEGAISAMVAAATSDTPAFIVLLAGPGVPGRAILERQLVELMRAALPKGEAGKPGPEEAISKASAAQRRLLKTLVEGGDRAAIRSDIEQLIMLQAGTDAEALKDDAEAAGFVRTQAESQTTMMTSPWMRRFLVLDPREHLAKVKVPVLALWGSIDRQVPPEQSMPEVQNALVAAGNTKATAKVLTGLNHLFQPARTGALVEYPEIETTFDPGALEEITTWLRARCGLGGP
ncbi:MAG: alpha/beta hydrolase family protein [Phycisphaerales bacterium]